MKTPLHARNFDSLDATPVLVLGGGINGAAVARELLLNDIPVVLVDRADIAGGATAASSRLIHGGLRYLEYADFSLVRESLSERTRLLQLAPHLVRPLELFIPVARRFSGAGMAAMRFFTAGRLATRGRPAPRGLWIIRAGLHLYDRFARRSGLPHHAVHRSGSAGVPPFEPHQYRWACSYYDAQMEFPERFVVALLHDAQRVAEQRQLRFEVLPYHQTSLSAGRARLAPASSSVPRSGGAPPPATRELEPALIVNATGAWVDLTLQKLDVHSRRLMGGTKGSHILTGQADLRAALGDHAVYAEACDGRPVFLLPFGRFVMVGTTDLPCGDDPDLAATEPAEVEYLLATVQQVFPHIRLTAADVILTWCGVRPLPYHSSSNPAAVTRGHVLEWNDTGGLPVLSLVGGKLTTCRQLAEEAALAVCTRLGRPVVGNSRDRLIPGGAGDGDGPDGVRRGPRDLAARGPWPADQVRAVWRLAGGLAAGLLEGSAEGPDRAAVPGTELPERFVRHVIRHEWCTHVTDLVHRRLLLPYSVEIQPDTLRRLAELMEAECGWPAGRKEAELRRCREELQARHGIAL